MKEYKLNIDRKMPSDSDIEKHKDFANLLAQLPQMPPVEPAKSSFFRRYGIYVTGVVVALIGIGLWISQPKEQKIQNTKVADSSVQIPANIEKTVDKPVIAEPKKEIISAENKAVSSKKVETAKEKVPIKIAEKEAIPKVVKSDEKPSKTESPAFVEPQKPKGRTLAFKTDISRFPELSIYQGVQWEYVGNSDEENPYKNGVLNVKNTWKSVEIEKKDATTYWLILKDKEGKTFSFPARPVFKDKDYDEAVKIYQEKMQGE